MYIIKYCTALSVQFNIISTISVSSPLPCLSLNCSDSGQIQWPEQGLYRQPHHRVAPCLPPSSAGPVVGAFLKESSRISIYLHLPLREMRGRG